MRKKPSFRSAVMLAVTTGLFTSVCNSALIDVSQIRITPSALNTQGWLQVSEVVAVETGSGNDLALASAGATTAASSIYVPTPGSHPDFAIDGVAPAPFPNIFHSNESDGSSFLDINLAAPGELDTLVLYGRADSFGFRDFYNVEIFDTGGNSIFTAFDLDATGSTNSVSIDLVSTVPIPAGVWLFSSGLAGLICAARRQKLPN